MNQIFRIVLTLLIVLLIAGGFFLFVFRFSAAESLRQQIQIMPTTSADNIKINPAEALDVELLKDPRFTSLVSHVFNFNFDNVCFRPGSDQVVVSRVDVPDSSASSTEKAKSKRVKVKCGKGNSTPFLGNN